MVCGVLDNLPGIRADHMNGKPGWQDWGLAELMQSLEEWKAIHPIKVNDRFVINQGAYSISAVL